MGYAPFVFSRSGRRSRTKTTANSASSTSSARLPTRGVSTPPATAPSKKARQICAKIGHGLRPSSRLRPNCQSKSPTASSRCGQQAAGAQVLGALVHKAVPCFGCGSLGHGLRFVPLLSMTRGGKLQA
jgi:hypothetical protein